MSRNYVFVDYTHPLHNPQGKGCNYALGTFKVYVERVIIRTLEGAHWIGNEKF